MPAQSDAPEGVPWTAGYPRARGSGCYRGPGGTDAPRLSSVAPEQLRPPTPARPPSLCPCPARQRPLPTAREDGAHPRRLPPIRAPRSERCLNSLPGAGTFPCTPPGRGAPGPRARGQDGSQVSPLRARGARDTLRGHPPGGTEPSGGGAGSGPAALAPGPGSWRLRRRLLLQEGAESSDFLLKGQLPPIDHTQRASSRQHPSPPRSLPPRPRPRSLAPPRVRSGGRGPGPARGGWAAPRVGAAPTAGSPGSPSRPSRGEPGARERGREGLGNPGLWKARTRASVSSSVKREEEKVGLAGEALQRRHG